MFDLDLKALRAAAEAATPGPWRVESMRPSTLGIETVWSAGMHDIADCSKAAGLPYSTRVPAEQIEANAAFIAAANPAAVLALLDELDAAYRALSDVIQLDPFLSDTTWYEHYRDLIGRANNHVQL